MHAVAREWRAADLDQADQALCIFAEKLTLHPQEMSAQHIDALRAAGFSDVAIHDAAQVIGYFNYINRVADALDVAPEDFVEPWGEPDAA